MLRKFKFYNEGEIILSIDQNKFDLSLIEGMQLGEQLASLKLQQSFVKELNHDDIDFAQKEYQKLYAEEMSKLSFKLEKIERVKRNLHDIEKGENSKLKVMKESLDKKYDFNQKNKQKQMTEKLKNYKIHHQIWENKISSIKRKNREYMRAHADKSQKYTEEVEQFWKTKTQEVFSTSHNHLETQKKKPQLVMSRRSEQRDTIKMVTEGPQRKKSNISKNEERLSRQNTQNNQLSQRNQHSRRETKSIRITTEGVHKEQNVSNLTRNRNESKNSQKFSHSLNKSYDTNNYTESRKSVKMPYLDQNRFSHQLSSEKKMNSTQNYMASKKSLHQSEPQGYKLSIRNQLLAQQNNFSFQKAMKKLDKIHKIKEKNMKKLQPSQNALSPCKPRKSIDAQQYRLLRAKSEVKKSKNKIDAEQNMQAKDSPPKDRFTGSRTIRNRTLGSEQRYHTTKNMAESRATNAQSRMRQEEERSKERSMAIESETKRWKKERIVKAIKDRIFKIKLEQMQKIKEKAVF